MQFYDPLGNYVPIYSGSEAANGAIIQTLETSSPSDCSIPVSLDSGIPSYGASTQYYLGSSGFINDLHLTTAGTYTILMAGEGFDARTSFYYTGSGSSNNTGEVSISTNQQTYSEGQSVTVSLTNDASTAYSYSSGCYGTFSVQDPSGQDLDLRNPNGAQCMAIMENSLQPGQTTVLGTWNQEYYDSSGDLEYAQPGTYTVTLQGLSTQFTISSGNNTLTPPSPPDNYSVTVNLNSGWNMVGIPVYVGETSSVQMAQNSCSISSVWGYSGNGYYRVEQSDLQPNTGYWFQVSSPCSITFTGDTATYASSYSAQLQPGWNLVSAPYSDSGSTSFSSLQNPLQDSCQLTSGPWEYDSTQDQYEPGSSLTPGEAYWVDVSNACTLGTG